MAVRVSIKYIEPEIFYFEYKLLSKKYDNVVHNKEWVRIERLMSVYSAKGLDISSQLSKFFVGKSLVVMEPRIHGITDGHEVLIEAEEVIPIERPLFIVRRVGQKKWDFLEYKNIKKVSLLNQVQAWERNTRCDLNQTTTQNQVDLVFKFWNAAPTAQVRDSVDKLDRLRGFHFHHAIPMQHFERLKNTIEKESNERFWSILGASEDDFIGYFYERMIGIKPKTIGEFRDKIRTGPSVKKSLAGIRLSRCYDMSEFKQKHGEELESLCVYNRMIEPIHKT